MLWRADVDLKQGAQSEPITDQEQQQQISAHGTLVDTTIFVIVDWVSVLIA